MLNNIVAVLYTIYYILIATPLKLCCEFQNTIIVQIISFGLSL